jgi:Protein of unknown function (DUF3617)
MRKNGIWITIVCCLFAVTVSAQSRKPGLWELTTTMTWQQSPFPPGMPANAMMGGAPQTTQICLTQEQIDKFGAITPESRGHSCQLTNVVKSDHNMSADMVCTGRMSGKGSMESSWTDDLHAKGSSHFLGSMQIGPNTKPVEWTSHSTSVFKSADCGAVKPLPMPANQP